MNILISHEGFEISDEDGNIVNIRRMIIEINDRYYYIAGESDGIRKILNFPDHMKDEWFNYNKEDLTIKHIDKFKKLIESDKPSIGWQRVRPVGKASYWKEYYDKLEILKWLCRDFILGKFS